MNRADGLVSFTNVPILTAAIAIVVVVVVVDRPAAAGGRLTKSLCLPPNLYGVESLVSRQIFVEEVESLRLPPNYRHVEVEN